jgi:hypothetical protein
MLSVQLQCCIEKAHIDLIVSEPDLNVQLVYAFVIPDLYHLAVCDGSTLFRGFKQLPLALYTRLRKHIQYDLRNGIKIRRR